MNKRVDRFKLETMVANPAIVMIAKRGTGKSYITRDIVYHYRSLPGGVVISPTDRLSGFYKFFFPDLYIHYDIRGEILQRILERQTLMIQKAQKKKKEGKKVDPSGILIMDDCLANKQGWVKDKKIDEVLMNGRHYQLTYLLTMQSPLGIPPHLRMNFDYAFLLKEDSAINKKKLYLNYASIFSSQYLFEKYFSLCTSDYCSMVVDNRTVQDGIERKIFWFKAEKRKFRFGSKSFYEFHKKYYDPNNAQRKLCNINLRNRKSDDIKVEKIK